MGDQGESGSSRRDSRAHWERYFSQPGEAPTPEPEPSLKGKLTGKLRKSQKSPKSPKPQSGRTNGLSVSDLVDRVGGEAETDVFPQIDKNTPPPRVNSGADSGPPVRPTPPAAAPQPKSEAVAAQRKEAPNTDDSPKAEQTAARPEVVGKPKMSRLAMSKVRRRRRLRMIGRATMATVAVIALLLTGVVWGYVRSADNGFLQVAALDENSTDVVDPGGQTGDETYLIVGTDSRAGKNSAVGAGTVADAEGSRSDTVMLVNIPANRERVVAVSFPRDLDVTRPECQGWDNDSATYTDEIYPSAEGDKLNATYALGGPKCLVKVIQKMSGLKIGHFVGMDFSGFESMVNEVGGVQVCTTTPLTDGELGPILTKAGSQKIDGKTALNYVRARTIEAEGNGDYGRIKRQQRFLSSLLRSALSNKVLLDPGKLNGFINAFTRDVFVQNVQTKDLVQLGRSLQNVDAGAVTFLTVPTAGTTDYGNEIPRSDDIEAIFQAIINDDPLPGETGTEKDKEAKEKKDEASKAPVSPPVVPVESAVDPGSISLQVSNGSGQSGVAATAADNFGSMGFPIYSVGNYTGTSAASVVRYAAGNEAQAATVASTITDAKLQEADDLGSIVEVVLGSDFGGTLKKPTPVGSPLAPVQTQPSAAGGAPPLPVDLSVTNAADDSCS